MLPAKTAQSRFPGKTIKTYKESSHVLQTHRQEGPLAYGVRYDQQRAEITRALLSAREVPYRPAQVAPLPRMFACVPNRTNGASKDSLYCKIETRRVVAAGRLSCPAEPREG